MRNIISELRVGNVRFFERMTLVDKIETLYNIKGLAEAVEIFKEVIPKIKDKINPIYIIDVIFNIKGLDSLVFELLNDYDCPEELEEKIMTYLLLNTSWGFDYVIDNIEKIFFKLDTETIFNIIKNDKEKAEKFKAAILRLKKINVEILFDLIVFLLSNDFYLDSEFIKKAVTSDDGKLIFNSLATDIFGINSNSSQLVYFENYEILYNSSLNKMEMMTSNPELFSKETLKYYAPFIRIYHLATTFPSREIDFIFSTLINNKSESELLTAIKNNMQNNEITYLDSGNTSFVLKIGNKVLKLGTDRYVWHVEPFFGIIPSTKQILTNATGENIGMIEWQDFIETESAEINEDLIYKLMLEFKKAGLEICDPRCLHFKKDNFGILKSYQSADTKDPKSLPEWFKKTPLVLLDSDLVIKMGDPYPLPMPLGENHLQYSMEKSIAMHEKKLIKIFE